MKLRGEQKAVDKIVASVLDKEIERDSVRPDLLDKFNNKIKCNACETSPNSSIVSYIHTKNTQFLEYN
jgi:hypothetical protein